MKYIAKFNSKIKIFSKSKEHTYCLFFSLLFTPLLLFPQDHIDQPIGPPPNTLAYESNFEPLKIYHIPANPEKGFHWSYYIATPKVVNPKMAIYVEPNNDGRSGVPYEAHDYWASIKCEQALIDFANELQTFAIVPVFPRPRLGNGSNLYVHALTRAVIEETSEKLKRIDLQLLAMINDAQSKIRDNGHEISNKFMLWGFSAAGDFVTRMALIHPDRVKCVVAGGLGGFPILPIESLEETTLSYPVGISDFKQLFNKEFNSETFRSIPMRFFQGGADENDSVTKNAELIDPESFISDSYSFEQCLFINKSFGEKPVERIEKVIRIYKNFGMKQFDYIIVPVVKHKTKPLKDQVLSFMKEHGSIN